MSWLIFALLSANFFSFVNLFDKFLRTKKFKNNYSFAVITGLIGLIILSFFTPFINFDGSFGWPLIFAFLSGIFYFVMWLFFWKALESGEISRVVAVFQVRPIFTAILAALFLKESLGVFSWIAVIMIVVGSLICSLEKNNANSKNLIIVYLLVIFSALLTSIGDIFSKLALRQMGPWALYWWSAFIILPVFLGLLGRKEIRKEITNNLSDKQSVLALIPRVVLGLLGSAFFYLAINSGSTGLSTAIIGIGPLLVFFYSTIVSFFWPKFIKENITPVVLLQKAFAIIFIVGGVILINF